MLYNKAMTFKQAKALIRDYMQRFYTDERLVWLLAHARSGNLSYSSCCCFIGVTTADHALKGARSLSGAVSEPHYMKAHREVLAVYDLSTLFVSVWGEEPPTPEIAFRNIGYPNGDVHRGLCAHGDERRIRILIPMIKAELRRRDLRGIIAAGPPVLGESCKKFDLELMKA